MSTEVDFGGSQEEVEEEVFPSQVSPDKFFANSAFRMVYQTNNFLLPQIRDLIDRGEVLNLRPPYQRRLRWSRRQEKYCGCGPRTDMHDAPDTTASVRMGVSTEFTVITEEFAGDLEAIRLLVTSSCQ